MEIIRGLWQLSKGHHKDSGKDPVDCVLHSLKNGEYVFDVADIYTGCEEILFKAKKRAGSLGEKMVVHTKFVPDLNILDTLNFSECEKIIDRSIARLGTELDLVQFHWWDYNKGDYLQCLDYLFRLQKKGKIKEVGLTNFNLERFQKILINYPVYSIQCQVSLVDQRAIHKLIPYAKKNNVKVFAYGTLLGGLLQEKWLGKSYENLFDNRSYTKYKLIIDEWGGWEKFQLLLRNLNVLKQKYGASFSQLAASGLENLIDAAIVGMTLENYEKHPLLSQRPQLNPRELESLVLKSNMGSDVYELERNINGVHGKIMKYNLNKV